MAPPVSLELCERIVVWRYELHMPIRDIVRLSNRCDKTVRNVLKIYQEYNQFTGPRAPFTQPRGRKRDDLNYLEAILCAEPGLFLDELQDKLRTVRDIEVSIVTLSRTLSRLAITHKSVKRAMLIGLQVRDRLKSTALGGRDVSQSATTKHNHINLFGNENGKLLCKTLYCKVWLWCHVCGENFRHFQQSKIIWRANYIR